MSERSLPEIRLLHAGELPVLWADAPPPHTVQLLFRVGRADETLASGGITHFVEHLAMPAEPPALECNAFVSYLLTGFWARGEISEVTEFLQGVAGRLCDLPLGRMEVERKILLAEEDLGFGPEQYLAKWRFGAVGFGLSSFPQLGLKRLTDAMVRDWARLRFTSSNAVLLWCGPFVDPGLDLADGPPHAIPEPWPAPGLKTPAFLNASADAVTAGLLLPRTSESELVTEVLRSRIARRLRFESGLVYGVDVVSGPLSDELAGTTICAPCRVDLAERVRDGLLAALDALATEGPTADELAVALQVLRTNESDPALVPNLLFRQAFEHLIGRRSQPLSDSLALLEATSPERVAEILSEALETALLVLPDGLEPGDSRFGPRLEAFPRERPVAGQEFQRRGAWRGGARKELLIVGRNGVSHTMPGADTFTVRWETCAAVGTWKDGTRVLWSESGFVICVWPQLWRKGEKATGLIDEHVPSDMVIDMGDDPRPLPS